MRKVEWTMEKIAEGFDKFNTENGHYPTATEIDMCSYLPSSRQIQRRFTGGLPELRKQLKLDCPTDFTKGEYSSMRAHTIGKRAHQLERTVYEYLIEHFGRPFVHREYFFMDDRRSRTDFFIYFQKGNFSVDVFFSKDRRSLAGCLNSKMRTYGQNPMLQYPVIFLMMNDDISEEEVVKILAQKKKKLHAYQQVMTFTELKKFCAHKTPLKQSS